MKPKIRLPIWALSSLMLATAFCVYRVNSQEVQPQSPGQQGRPLTKEEVQSRQQFHDQWERAKENNFRAKHNNGSKRKGLKAEQLPEKVRPQAEALAQQYKEEIYPKLKKYVADHQGLLPSPAFAIPELAIYMEDAEYKGVGPKSWGRGSWALDGGQRPDGTLAVRDVYSNNLPDEPHDIWGSYSKFANYPTIAKGFTINGWDDGQVTFDPAEQNFYGVGKDFRGQEHPGAAVPGQAGIPPEFKQGLKPWFKKLDKDMKDAKLSKKGQPETGKTETSLSSEVKK